MANVLCVIELHDGRALPVCLEVLGQARRISTRLGGTLYAVVASPRAPGRSDDELIESLARGGADKVVLVTDDAVKNGTEAGAMRWGTHGPALVQVAELLPPLLLLFGATSGARDVAPRTAARLGAAYLWDAWVEIDGDKLALFEGAGADARALDGELEFPVVAIVPPGRYQTAAGDDEAEVEVVPGQPRTADFNELGWESDPEPSSLVLVPAPPETFDQAWAVPPVTSDADEAAADLARALGGAVRRPDEPARARLVVAVAAPLDRARADVRIEIGEALPTVAAHYALPGDPTAQARALAEALRALDGGEKA